MYVTRALATNPAVQAAFDRWRASVHQIARAQALPEPTLQFAAFLQSVETRVGPQQAKLSLKQAFPWPTKLTQSGRAAAATARAAEHAFEATALQVALQVESSYWRLWELRATRTLHQDHLQILDGLAATVRARVETGGATFADLQQIDLSRARLEDQIHTQDARERAAIAALRAAVGDLPESALPTPGTPTLSLPTEPPEQLQAAVRAHPTIARHADRANASTAQARSLQASRLPDVTLGADWILTGPALDPTSADSGKDAIIAGVGLRIPLWQGTYSHAIAGAQAEAAARRGDQLRETQLALASLEQTLATVEDSARRARVIEQTLLPQADGAYTSILGNYAAGRGTVAQTLLAQRDLLDLTISLAQARAQHQRAWAQLQQLVGREITSGPAQ